MPDLQSLSDEQLQVYKDLLQKKGTIPPEKPVGGFGPTEEEWKKAETGPFNSTVGKLLDVPYKGAQEFAQGAKDLLTPGSRMKGAHEAFQGALGVTSPITAPLAIANPATALTGLAGATVGGTAGKYIPKLFHASEDVSNLASDVGALAGGALTGVPQVQKFSGAVGSGLKAAAPDLAKGGVKIAAGEALSHVPGMQWPARIALDYPGARNVASGISKGTSAFKEAYKGAVGEPPGVPQAPTQKAPNLSMLTTAVKLGSITPEQFEAQLDKLGYDPDAKALIKENVRTSLAPKKPITPDESPKTLSLSHLQQATKQGLLSPEDFDKSLERLGYNDKDRGILSELLKREMESEKEGEVESKSQSSQTSPGPKVASQAPQGPSPLVVKMPGTESSELPLPDVSAFLETEAPHKPPITQEQIEEAQAPARSAKENTLARHFVENNVDLAQIMKIPKTQELLNSLGKEAGLKRAPSLRTLENAIQKAHEIRSRALRQPQESSQ